MRSQDIHLAVKILVPQKQILFTGAIDTNDVSVVARFPIPEPGLWTFIKAETNLTNDAWLAWQISLGAGVLIPSFKNNRIGYSRQFSDVTYNVDKKTLLFRGGEVRPGDSMLKVYTLECTEESLAEFDGKGSVSHNRSIVASDDEMLKAGTFGLDKPKIEIETPYQIIGGSVSIPR